MSGMMERVYNEGVGYLRGLNLAELEGIMVNLSEDEKTIASMSHIFGGAKDGLRVVSDKKLEVIGVMHEKVDALYRASGFVGEVGTKGTTNKVENDSLWDEITRNRGVTIECGCLGFKDGKPIIEKCSMPPEDEEVVFSILSNFFKSL